MGLHVRQSPALTVAEQGIETAWKAGFFLASVSPALPLVGVGGRGNWPNGRLPGLSPHLPKPNRSSFSKLPPSPLKKSSRSSLSAFYWKDSRILDHSLE